MQQNAANAKKQLIIQCCPILVEILNFKLPMGFSLQKNMEKSRRERNTPKELITAPCNFFNQRNNC
jgi:hypothetical protein